MTIVGGEIGVDSGSLRQAGGTLTDEAKAIVTALDTLRKVLDAQGGPWGADELGARFGSEYTGFAAQAFAAIGTYRDQVAFSGGAHSEGARCWVDLERFNSGQARPAGPAR
ncbi:hypothetical protein [Phytohabitans suffuscus]|uniref:hypothetical protein n=1 Tax=Phytohabitans suffuscus TaxID=624315 RepID=UPI001562F77D|nr:hypothetical protein [Phytohabitans suffuscus]